MNPFGFLKTLRRFLRYAGAFERTYEDDNWQRLEKYFTEDAVYEVRGAPRFPIHAKGRQEVLDALHHAVDNLDRRFDSRKVYLRGLPWPRTYRISFPWGAKYERQGAPPLVIAGTEEITYRDGLIVHMVDTYDAKKSDSAEHWFEQYEDLLKPTPD